MNGLAKGKCRSLVYTCVSQVLKIWITVPGNLLYILQSLRSAMAEIVRGRLGRLEALLRLRKSALSNWSVRSWEAGWMGFNGGLNVPSI